MNRRSTVADGVVDSQSLERPRPGLFRRLTENLTTDLSRLRGSFVIAPQHRLHVQRQECRRPRTRQGARVPYVPEGALSRATPAAYASTSSSSTPKAASIFGWFTAGHSDNARAEAVEHSRARTRCLGSALGCDREQTGASSADRSLRARSLDHGVVFFIGSPPPRRLHVSLGKRALCILKVRRGLQLC